VNRKGEVTHPRRSGIVFEKGEGIFPEGDLSEERVEEDPHVKDAKRILSGKAAFYAFKWKQQKGKGEGRTLFIEKKGQT